MSGSFDFTITANDQAGEQLERAASAAESLAEKVDDARKKMAEASDAMRGLNGGLSEATGAESQRNADTMTAYFERLSTLGNDTARHFGDIIPPLRNIGALSSELTGVLGRFGLAGVTVAAGGLAVGSVAGQLKSASDEAYALDVHARNTGMSVSQFSRFAGLFRLMGKSAGQAREETSSLFKVLNDTANIRNPKVTGILNQFGISLSTHQDGRVNLEKSTQSLTDAFGRMSSSAQKVVADALGLSDAQLALLRNTKDLNASLADAENLKLSMPDNLNAKLVQSNMNINRLLASFDALTVRMQANIFGSDFVTGFTDKMTRDMTLLNRLLDGDVSASTISKLAISAAENPLLPGGSLVKSLLPGERRDSVQRSERLNYLTRMLADDLSVLMTGHGGENLSGSQWPRGIRNNNPGNLEAARNASGSDGRFVTFSSPGDGISALARQLRLYGSRGINTVNSIIGTYAPPVENKTDSYIRSVSGMTGFSRNQPLNLEDPAVLEKLIPAIIRHENGVQPYSSALISDSVKNAFSGSRWGARELTQRSIVRPKENGVTRDDLAQVFTDNKIRLDISVTNTSTGQTTRQTVKGGTVATAMEL
ncbi:lytic transglycosylase domain-containing protein [Escherichia coli]|uniref:lytic transglycosylase domain-containing protein n=1 Tax=Escherichia coli TaxID=562 RepID=UPI001F104849|nr:lytic transglycosylase domain-containing protein [Escherichia coli]UMR99563.1 transglycosylase [Escherichia coli]